MDATTAKRLADLAIGFGANVSPGQVVAIGGEPGKEYLVRAIAESAYEHGAKFVDVAWFDPHVKLARLRHADEESLGWVPPWYGQRIQEIGRIANGYDLVLADRGESLSGGQRQAIALARALAGKPNLLVFDEPTSAMDAESEAGLINRLIPELAGRTVVLITHRMSLLRMVDRVVLMREGKIIGDGTRDEFLARMAQQQKAA